MTSELQFLKGNIDNFSTIEPNANNLYITTGVTDGDYRLYLGDKLLAKCGSIDFLRNMIESLDVVDSSVANQYVSSVNQDNGLISVSRSPLIKNDDSVLTFNENEGVSSVLSITEVFDDIDENILHRYALIGKNNQKLGSYIDIYKDSSLKNVELVDDMLTFTYLLSNGTEQVIGIDVTKFLSERQFAEGLQINASGVVSIKIDNGSENYLTASLDGLKINGINDVISSSVSNETDRATEAENLLQTKLSDLETIVTDNNTNFLNKLSIEEENRINEDDELKQNISSLTTDLSTLNNKVSSEITRAEEKDAEHDTKIINLGTAISNTLNLVEGGNGVNVSEINENKQVISVKLNEDITNTLINNENGLYLNNIWNCGTY